MLDQQYIGHRLGRYTADVEARALQFFAKATGQTDPVLSDEAAARAAGHPALLVPPTFLFCLEMMSAPNPRAMYELLEIDIGRVLHGEQHFEYKRLVHAGETLTFEAVITDMYEKKNGALEFVVRETLVQNQAGDHVANLRSVVVVRNPLEKVGV